MTKHVSQGYIALVHKDKDTSYGVSFPDVPGCISAGETFVRASALPIRAPSACTTMPRACAMSASSLISATR